MDTLVYKTFIVEGGKVTYIFKNGENEYRDSYTFPFDLPDSPEVQRLLFTLGVSNICCFWMLNRPENIFVEAGSLNQKQCDWWENQIITGCGEFFYRNNIPVNSEMISIKSTSRRDRQTDKQTSIQASWFTGCVIANGGGKDSSVSMSLLGSDDNIVMMLNPSKAHHKTALAAGFNDENTVCIRRSYPGNYTKLWRKTKYFVHPVQALGIIALEICGLITACAKNKRYVAFSNESSANESYVPNMYVNHQYCKSYELEKSFREYLYDEFGTNFPQLFSLLRPWNEWKISKKFSELEHMHPVFRSCNDGELAGKWCHKCSKCLFTYIALAAFLPDNKLRNTFKENLLEKPEFSETFEALLNPELIKPWECVGTREEINHMVFNAAQIRKDNLPYLLRGFTAKPQYEQEIFFNNEHFVPDEYIELLK